MACVLNLDEWVEDSRQHVRRNAAASIGNDDFEIRSRIGRSNCHGPIFSELHRIPDQVEENSSEMMFIQQNGWHTGRLVD